MFSLKWMRTKACDECPNVIEEHDRVRRRMAKGDVDAKTEESVSKGELEVVNLSKKQGVSSGVREVIGAKERF
ncbi:hypothetical protein DER46DRAFT_167453 [Fusarium sp. MPI-SDFR-AT-0072]|nr:hypothetical protein DER46DRAFT_167453 [Fusarium sp. MPI-SDFR-AT-0072]